MVAIVSAASGNVNVAANWNPAQVPTSADDVTIDGHTMTVPSGVTFEPLSLVLQGSSDSVRGELISEGTYKASGGCTLNAWNALAARNGGVIDLAGGTVEATSGTSGHNKLDFVGTTTDWVKITDSVGGGNIYGVSGANMRATLTMQYCTVDMPGELLAGGSYNGGTPVHVEHVVLYQIGYFGIGEPFVHGDDDFIFRHVDIIGTSSVRLDTSTLIGVLATRRVAAHSSLGETDVSSITANFSDKTAANTCKLRFSYSYYDVDGVFDNLNVEFTDRIETDSPSLKNTFHVDRYMGGIAASTDVNDSYFYCKADNPHGFTSRNHDNNIIEAVYEIGDTDGGDFYIAPDASNMSVTNTLLLDSWGGVLLNALGTTNTGVYSAQHNTIVLKNTVGVQYGNLARNESGGVWAGTLNMYDNLCCVEYNDTGTYPYAIHLPFGGDDQITAMDNNAYFGYGSDQSRIYHGVTSATKSIGDTDYGESDLINVDPQFVDPTRTLATWQNAQNGGGTADDAISNALSINGYDAATQTQIAANESGFDVSAVISWVKGGYAPTNSAYDGTASDSGTIGAVDYTAASTPGGTAQKTFNIGIGISI